MKTIKIPHFSSMAVFTIILAASLLTACASSPAGQPVSQSSSKNLTPVSPTAVSSSSLVSATKNPSSVVASGSNPSLGVSFTASIMPIMQVSCVSCHGGQKTSKGLDLKTYSSLMLGSQNGSMIVPGDATKSKLIESVQSGKMPKRGAKLTPAQIQLLVDWVNAGAQNN
ncbi:MAG: hypothetical protein NTW32_23650 [Chloroflexi bacterium]|nr:hypothetical protein [Chloroflexota bacterium]